MEKSVQFLKGHTAKFKPKLNENFVESQVEERSL